MKAGFLTCGKYLDDNRYVSLYVQTQSGKHRTSVTVDPKASVGRWKSAIASIFNFNPEVQERYGLMHDGELLDEERMASEYQILADATLVLVPKAFTADDAAQPEDVAVTCDHELTDHKAAEVVVAPNQSADDNSTELPSEGDTASSGGAEQIQATTRLAERKRRQRRSRARARELSEAQQVNVESPFSVFVQTQKGQRKSIDVKSSETIEDIEKSVEQLVPLSFSSMNLHLSFNGKKLERGSISECGICAGSVLTIMKDVRT